MSGAATPDTATPVAPAAGGGAPAAGGPPGGTPAPDSAPAAGATPPEGVLGDAKAPETKPEAAAEAKPETKPEGEVKPAADAKPEAVVYEFKFPEGVQVDNVALDAFKAMAAENKVAPETAQKLLDQHIGALQTQAAKLQESWWDQQRTWIGEIKADTEIGGKNFDRSRALFAKGVTALAKGDAAFEEGLRTALNMTGAGNNPFVVKAFVRLMDALGVEEGDHIGGGVNGKAKELNGSDGSAATSIYPTLPSGAGAR